jgi:hypothetical protein
VEFSSWDGVLFLGRPNVVPGVSLTSPIALRNCGSTESDEDLELIEDVRQIYSQIKTSGTLYESTSLLRKY